MARLFARMPGLSVGSVPDIQFGFVVAGRTACRSSCHTAQLSATQPVAGGGGGRVPCRCKPRCTYAGEHCTHMHRRPGNASKFASVLWGEWNELGTHGFRVCVQLQMNNAACTMFAVCVCCVLHQQHVETKKGSLRTRRDPIQLIPATLHAYYSQCHVRTVKRNKFTRHFVHTHSVWRQAPSRMLNNKEHAKNVRCAVLVCCPIVRARTQND